jgi:AraC family transcriptional regulator
MRPEDYLNNVRPDGTASYLELNAETPHLSSRGRGWEGIVVERDRFLPFDNGYVVYDEHVLVLFLGKNAHVSFAVDRSRYEGAYRHGDLILSPGQQPVHWRLEDATDALIISIHPDALGRIVRETTGADPAAVHIIGQPRLSDPLIPQIGLALLAELEGPGLGERLYVDSLVNTLTLHLLRHHSSLSERPIRSAERGLPRARLRRAIEAINDHLEVGISLNELAAAAGVGRAHFEVLFKRATGVSPHQYLLRCRVERVKDLLRSGDSSLTLAQVAARAGFCDQSHLTRHFKRLVGTTPAAYRESS